MPPPLTLYLVQRLGAAQYKELYAPIEKELEQILGDIDDKIEFSVDITLTDSEIGSEILTHFNKNMIGIFQGVENASTKMKELIDQTQFDSIDSIMSFIDIIVNDVTVDMDAGIKKVKQKEKLYNEIFCLDYVEAEYKLKLGGRALQALSPGEKGIVLLVFYLALSKNDIPLIIDQPEDNLDNQSVYDKLVPCIKAAKNRRQVFIVTHNPNIAIACDAEQIITCHIDKKDNHIEYLSGSIESKEIREAVIDILEGTMPAFDLRRLKYTSDHYFLEE